MWVKGMDSLYFATTQVTVGKRSNMKHYEKEKMEAVKMLGAVVESRGDTNMALLGSIMSALYDIANELHELNSSLRAGVDDGR